ncbi:unnamed protein product [Polarella glacialis]|uniref:Ubiquitin-like domain-containing protein n=1 Tax=Polarella glacialis TaxID=89957 RepID=A0A813GXC9_POLGL|nr:unnamed protein product [Polarella glacialis]
MPATSDGLRVLVFSYEFTYCPFSGNGVLARSLVKGLLSLGCRVLVVCCRPAPDATSPSLCADNPIGEPEVAAEQLGALQLEPIELSAADGWRRLDRQSAWQGFQAGALKLAGCVQDFGPSVALAIDWTGGLAWQSMLSTWPKTTPHPRLLYINFRVYSSGLTSVDESRSWYDERERQVLTAAGHVLALSTHDQKSLRALMPVASQVQVGILLPCLRGDMQVLAAQPTLSHLARLPPAAAAAAAACKHSRCFVTCAVRISREKNPLLFVQLVEAIGAALDARGFVPLLCCGAVADEEYAREVRQRLRAAAPNAVLLDTFLGPEALAAVFTATALNVHPCLYDAYGMSLVEAAAFGAPSLLNGGGAVGATALLNATHSSEGNADVPTKGCLELDFASPVDSFAAATLAHLDNAQDLALIAGVARTRALAWSEKAAGVSAFYFLIRQCWRDGRRTASPSPDQPLAVCWHASRHHVGGLDNSLCDQQISPSIDNYLQEVDGLNSGNLQTQMITRGEGGPQRTCGSIRALEQEAAVASQQRAEVERLQKEEAERARQQELAQKAEQQRLNEGEAEERRQAEARVAHRCVLRCAALGGSGGQELITATTATASEVAEQLCRELGMQRDAHHDGGLLLLFNGNPLQGRQTLGDAGVQSGDEVMYFWGEGGAAAA